MRKHSGQIIYSPSDLVRYLGSPFASWMDRYHLENPADLKPDEETEDQKLIAETGNQHELRVLEDFRGTTPERVEIQRDGDAIERTRSAVVARAPMIYQASLQGGEFAGFSDFILLDDDENYQIWDTKLATSPKPYYAVQLCCYSEMFAETTGEPMPERFGIILGNDERVEFRVEDFIHYYRYIKDRFLEMQRDFTGNLDDRPEPLPRADHGRWTSHADSFLDERDHLVRVAGISVGHIKKLHGAGITTLAQLAESAGMRVTKLPAETLNKLSAQARLQNETRTRRKLDPNASAIFEIIPQANDSEVKGLAALPAPHPADVFFDMEGYPLVTGGLEYLFGATTIDSNDAFKFHDWWAHDRDEEKLAFEGFIDWVHPRWRSNPGMHIYHYAAYELSALRRLSTRHDTRQDEVDDILRHEVLVDLYQIVRQGLRIGEDSYSIKKVERLYRPERATDVASGTESIVQYARWMESDEPRAWNESNILKGIRDYNKDDCDSTAELSRWLRKIAVEHGVAVGAKASRSASPDEPKELSPETALRLEVANKLRARGDEISLTLGDLVDFHRREDKPLWWRRFDRAASEPDVLRDDNGCIASVEAVGDPTPEKKSLLQSYTFDAAQECKLAAAEKSCVMFTHRPNTKLNLFALDSAAGTLTLKATQNTLNDNFDGSFPASGSLIPDEIVNAGTIPEALTWVAQTQLKDALPATPKALLTRKRPAENIQLPNEATVHAAIRVALSMSGGCLVIQGPPGTGKTYTAARVIDVLLGEGRKIGITSNSHKAVINLMKESASVAGRAGKSLVGVKVGGDCEDDLFTDNPGVKFVKTGGNAYEAYSGGVLGGTAWVFTRDEWIHELDFLFIEEAGQVSLANVVAMSRCAKNLVLLGDQMQLEQPIQGSHPGDSGLSALQYALKDLDASKEDAPVFHAVVPADYGLFLGESRRMHPAVCTFISESVYEARLGSHADCAIQKIEVPDGRSGFVSAESGIVFIGVEHDGNVQKSEEEVERVRAIYDEMIGRNFTCSDGTTKVLELSDFLFIAPYNAQVRALQAGLPEGARVGSVDKFQGQQAPVCILSLCSSYGEYGSRGLGFILDRNRINVAISRAQCLAIVVADPRIAGASAGSLGEMMLINLFCKLTTQSSVCSPKPPQ